MNLKGLKSILFFIIIAVLLPLSACNKQDSVSGSVLEFSIHTETPESSEKEKLIYINDDMEQLELNARLKVDSGSVNIQILDNYTKELLWEEQYDEDTDFIMSLEDIRRDTAYILKVETIDTKDVDLTVASDVKLVKNPVRPEKKGF